MANTQFYCSECQQCNLVLNSEQVPHISRSFASSSWLELNQSPSPGQQAHGTPQSQLPSHHQTPPIEPQQTSDYAPPVVPVATTAAIPSAAATTTRFPEENPAATINSRDVHQQFHQPEYHQDFDSWYPRGEDYSPQHHYSSSGRGPYLQEASAPSPLWSSANVFSAASFSSGLQTVEETNGATGNNMFFGSLPWKDLLVNERSNSRGSMYSSSSSDQEQQHPMQEQIPRPASSEPAAGSSTTTTTLVTLSLDSHSKQRRHQNFHQFNPGEGMLLLPPSAAVSSPSHEDYGQERGREAAPAVEGSQRIQPEVSNKSEDNSYSATDIAARKAGGY